ncbi:MAG: hypothetical protein RBT64_09745 [Trichloromonas sp.]|jgi:hypothetical protein|nr:hypothetical protein [Trichloromonas sp.]
MKRLFKTIFWTFFLILLLLGIDQYFVRVSASQPAVTAVRAFYLDFRARLPRLLPDGEPVSVEAVIEAAEKGVAQSQPTALAPKKAAPVSAAAEPKFKYLYADADGGLHFAATLEEIPEPFRRQAQRLTE